jgi:hypothetical protein
MLDFTDASQAAADRLEAISRRSTGIMCQVCTGDMTGAQLHAYLKDVGYDPLEGKSRIEVLGQMHLLTEVNRLREAVPPLFGLLEWHARRKFKKPTVTAIAAALGETVATISQYRRKNEAKREWIWRIAALEDLPPSPPRKRSPKQKRSD